MQACHYKMIFCRCVNCICAGIVCTASSKICSGPLRGAPYSLGKTAFGSGICITISSFWFLASSPFSLLIQSQPPVSPSAFPYNPSWGTGPKDSPLPPVPFLSLLFSFAPFSWLYSISLNSIRSWFGPRIMKNRTPFSQKGSSSMPRLTISYPCSRALS